MADFSLALDGQTARQLAASYCMKCDLGTIVEWTKSNRTLEQNSALHGLLAQIVRQRPERNGLRMTVPLYKAAFMHALGEEVKFMPSLDGTTVFPLGLSTSRLTKERFSDLIEFILAWCAKEGLTVEHFDPQEGSQDGATNKTTPSVAAKGGREPNKLPAEAVGWESAATSSASLATFTGRGIREPFAPFSRTCHRARGSWSLAPGTES